MSYRIMRLRHTSLKQARYTWRKLERTALIIRQQESFAWCWISSENVLIIWKITHTHQYTTLSLHNIFDRWSSNSIMIRVNIIIHSFMGIKAISNFNNSKQSTRSTKSWMLFCHISLPIRHRFRWHLFVIGAFCGCYRNCSLFPLNEHIIVHRVEPSEKMYVQELKCVEFSYFWMLRFSNSHCQIT